MRDKEWRIQQKKADFTGLGERLGVSPFLVRIMRNRGLTSYEEMEEFLYAGIEKIPSAWTMKGIKEGVEILKKKIEENKKIHIIGDYDVDGICATAILYLCLKNVGARVSYRLPHRINDGYGMNMGMVEEAKKAGVDTIITCDNGIAAFNEVDFAKSLGMTVIITDHHTVQEKGMPKADVIINPHQPEETYEYKDICGCVVAWKVCLALYELMGLDREYVWNMIELAGLATVQDAMDLIHENRIIVKETLTRISDSNFIGIKKLIQICEFKEDKIKATNLAFGINPCINAGGRLKSPDLSLELLLCEDEEKADKLASELKACNDERKKQQEENLNIAKENINQTNIINDNVIVIVLEECHESLAGLVAGKLKELYYKPCIVLTKGKDGELKGSGRSIPAYHMFNELQKCSDLLIKFGGHPMAAGLSIKKSNVDEFRRRLNQNCTLTKEELTEKVFIDMVMPAQFLNKEWIDQLEKMEPTGNGNDKPTFAMGDLEILKVRIMGKEENHLKLRLKDKNGILCEAVYFFGAKDFEELARKQVGDEKYERLCSPNSTGNGDLKISLIYEPLVNKFNEIESIELKIKDYHLK